jgi:S-adenosylmethionine:tRNA ribosyltransferase-isomerase
VSNRLSDYTYDLPEELIAQRPLEQRDASRMMVLHRANAQIQHTDFRALPSFIGPGDLLVLNDTRVVTARRFSDDGTIEFLFLEQVAPRRWKCLVRPGRKMKRGATAQISGAEVRVEEVCTDGERIVSADRDVDLLEGGFLPLPPYVRRQSDAADAERYQTIFAKQAGAVAAPTAGLHFTAELLAQLPHTFVTLHVGAGTFRPVQTEEISEHRMHAERFSISQAAAEAINAAERIIAVGTTTVRVLESAKREGDKIVAQNGATDIFIHPPKRIRCADALLTNFHLPRSTLLMLVSAFAGREFILRAYQEAIRACYRFYSYGDCMLIL